MRFRGEFADKLARHGLQASSAEFLDNYRQFVIEGEHGERGDVAR
jgi:hypothetical protein